MLSSPLAVFDSPAVAAAALAAAIVVPLVVHLLFRRRERIIRWAAMRFLPVQPPPRNRRIDHWPLFLTRLSALLLPLLAMFAVLPAFERLWQRVSPGEMVSVARRPRTYTILIVDASLSMTARHDGATLLDAAKTKALDVLNAANPGDGFSLIVLDGTANVRISNPSLQHDLVRQEIAQINPFHGPSGLLPALVASHELLSRSSGGFVQRRVTVITDRQRSSWNGLRSTAGQPLPEIWDKLTARCELSVVDVGLDNLENLTVAELALVDSLPIAGDEAVVTATIRNAARRERRNVRVELALGRTANALSVIAQQTMDVIPANGQSTINFSLQGPLRFREAAPMLLRARILADDPLSTDNERFLAFDVREGLNALLVNGRPSGQPLRRSSEFFSEALAPGGRRTPGNPFRTRTIGVEEFQDSTLSNLTSVDCLVLCDVPSLTPSQMARIETHLKRGGGVIIGLGPISVTNREYYNRLLVPAGLLPGPIQGEIRGDSVLTVPDESYRGPPLSAFTDAKARAALASVPFRGFARLEIPDGSTARCLASFTLLQSSSDERPAPALLEFLRHRGHVFVFTSTFNREWTDWPVLPSFLPFVHELVRATINRRGLCTLSVGEPMEWICPSASIGSIAALRRPDGTQETAIIQPGESEGLVRFDRTTMSGTYELEVPGRPTTVLAVNVPANATGLDECDLRTIDIAEFRTLVPNLQIVREISEIHGPEGREDDAIMSPRPRGPLIARWLTIVAVVALLLELALAWRIGAGTNVETRTAADSGIRGIGWLIAFVMSGVLIVLLPACMTGELPSFVPYSVREQIERQLEVPRELPGEGTRWRFATQRVFSGHPPSDRYGLLLLFSALVIGAVSLAVRERRAVKSFRAMLLPLILRCSAYALVLLVVLPQLTILFEREGMPEIAIILDDSSSMATMDTGQQEQRLQRAIQVLLSSESNVLMRLHSERRVNVRLYAISEQARLIGSIEAETDREEADQRLRTLTATGDVSRLGEGVESVIKAHRGGALAAIVLFSDGVTTQGADLSHAGRVAARAGVPLFTVGVGERREHDDLGIVDLKSDDVVTKGDEWIVEGRISVRGDVTGPVTLTLFEKRGDAKVSLQTITLQINGSGKPLPFKLSTKPTQVGETTYVIEAVPVAGETDTTNNRIERTVMVTETKKLRVLLIDGRPRYEFRFLKTLFEREVEAGGERSFDFRFYLADSSKDFATIDRAALRLFPSRSELYEYDVVILGDVDPATLPPAALADLAEFVKQKGGGLMLIAGEQNLPAKYWETAIADVIPLLPSGEASKPATEEQPIIDGYRLLLSPLGRQHPMLRLASDDAENQSLWRRLTPLFWHASGYSKRMVAEVLATHPSRSAEGTAGELHPLILQQFAGAGRVLFLGFDESWRWRLRSDEELFNRFWRQAVRVIGRNRVSRVEIRSDKPGIYRRDEPVTITVRFPDDAPVPTEAVVVACERTLGNDRETSSMKLRPVVGQRATYEAALSRTPEGKYRFRLSAPTDVVRPPVLEVSVIPPPGERERLELDEAELRRAAMDSDGKYYPIAACNEMLNDLPEGLRLLLNEPCPPLPLWNQPILFASIVTLLGLEWILRKRARLL